MDRRTGWSYSVVCLLVAGATAACGSDATTSADKSAAKSAAPAPSAASPSKAIASASAAAPTAAPSASAAAADADPCKAHHLEKGAGTESDKCRFDDDVLTWTYAGTLDDAGAAFAITNPWSEDVDTLSAAVFYYDKDGKQLTVKVADKDQPADRLDAAAVKLPGGKTTTVPLGLAKKDLPPEVDSVELQILSFGVSLADGKRAYYESTTPFSKFRGIHGGEGPTGIAECDEYKSMLESCPTKFPDALAAMRKSLRQYNNASPDTQKRLADQLKSGCESGMASSAARCKAD